MPPPLIVIAGIPEVHRHVGVGGAFAEILLDLERRETAMALWTMALSRRRLAGGPYPDQLGRT